MVDRDALQPIHASHAAEDLLPGKHLVDAGYVDAGQWVISAHGPGIELIGPVPRGNQWRAKTVEVFTIQDFPSTGTANSQPIRSATPAGAGPLSATRTER